MFVVSRTAEHARDLAERIDGGWAAADLTDEAQVDAAVEAAIAQLGRIDGCFTVAGGSGRRFGDGLDPHRRRGGLGGDRAAQPADPGPDLRPGRPGDARAAASTTPGRAARWSSSAASRPRRPVPELFGTHAYAAAKGALTALMTVMAATYVTDRIRVNLVAPSLTRTPMAARAAGDEHILEYASRKQPLAGEMLDPLEVANAALFFLSDESRAVTGQNLAVDGGWSLVSTTAEPRP